MGANPWTDERGGVRTGAAVGTVEGGGGGEKKGAGGRGGAAVSAGSAFAAAVGCRAALWCSPGWAVGGHGIITVNFIVNINIAIKGMHL